MLCLVLGDPFQAFVSSSFFLVSNEQSPTKVVLEKEKMLVQNTEQVTNWTTYHVDHNFYYNYVDTGCIINIITFLY